MSVNAKKRLYLEALGITVYADKNKPWLDEVVPAALVSRESTAKNTASANVVPITTSTATVEELTISDDALDQLLQAETDSVTAPPFAKVSAAETKKQNDSVVEKQQTLTALLDVVLVQNNHGVAVVADVADFPEAFNNWNNTQEFLLDIARATTVSLFGDECDLAKARAQKINGAMSVAGQLKSDKASADFLQGALLGPKNVAPKMLVMLGAKAAFFTEFGEGRELFPQRLLGDALPQLINSTEAKQALWKAIQTYALGD